MAEPFEAYARSPEAHATMLRHLLTSPLAYRHFRDHQHEDTDATRLGRAVHTAILEPDKLGDEFAVWAGEIRRGAKWDDFREQAGRKTILTRDQHEQVLAMRDAVRSHPIAGRYLAEPGKAEISIKWTHASTGVRIKCRLDWLCSCLIDVKTSRDVSPHAFASSAAKFGYPLQLALYADAAAVAGFGALDCKIVAVQSTDPIDVAVYALDDEFLDVGRDQYERALETLIECEASGSWPGIASSDELPLRLPAWAFADSAGESLTFGGEAIF